MKTSYLTIVLCCLLTIGCLQPPAPVTPPTDTLSAIITKALDEERKGVAAVAMQVSLTPTESDQKSLWETNNKRIRDTCANTIAGAVKSSLSSAGNDPNKIAAVWKEVAQGYGH